MQSDFAAIGQVGRFINTENSFWPSFTDIMMVITMIFLMATSLLVVRNWQLLAELQESVEAEQLAFQTIQITVQENATLEERLANAAQTNLALRLQILKKNEALQDAKDQISQQQVDTAQLKGRIAEFVQILQDANRAARAAELEIEYLIQEKQLLTAQLADMEQQFKQKAAAHSEEIEAYNQQILALKGEYEIVKGKYHELVKPARSAKGKYIAEVYYVKDQTGTEIRYKQPGDASFIPLSLAEVEQRLDQLKQQKGKDLYVKVIIPDGSQLTYSEAWDFTRNILVKYDYYYQ